MSKTRLNLNGGEYALVADRIELFYESFPDGRIITELVSRANGEITFKASVYRAAADAVPAATGWASERENDGDVNTVACLENTETSAIGRALANLGFTAAKRRPSVEEMESADRARQPSPLGIGTRPPEPPSFPSPASTGSDGRVPSDSNAGPSAAPDAVADVLALLDMAQRSGYSAERAQRARQRLANGAVPAVSLLRVERALRRWLAERSG